MSECPPSDGPPLGFIVDDLDVLVRRGLKFGCVYADPPWRYDRAPRGATRYRTMELADIAALPVSDLALPNAHLHLWTTHSFLFQSRRILEAWGFEYRSMFVWVKPQIGTGYYWRSACEYMLLGVRGACTFRDRSVRNWLCHKRTDHSRKPDQVRELVERVSPGPYLELFGRAPAAGWFVFGDQVDAGGLFQKRFVRLD